MPIRSRHRKHRRFIDLSAHKRRDAVIQLKWKIQRNAVQAGHTVFWTDHLMEDPDFPDRQHQWIDVVFLGRDRCTLWNAEIITTGLAVDDAISNRAYEVAYAKLSEEEAKAEFAMEFKPVPRKSPSDTRCFEWVRRPKISYPQFEGTTFQEECQRLEMHFRATEPPTIGESFTTDRNYAYGIGLEATVAETNLDRAAVERTIARFRDIGESDWRQLP